MKFDTSTLDKKQQKKLSRALTELKNGFTIDLNSYSAVYLKKIDGDSHAIFVMNPYKSSKTEKTIKMDFAIALIAGKITQKDTEPEGGAVLDEFIKKLGKGK